VKLQLSDKKYSFSISISYGKLGLKSVKLIAVEGLDHIKCNAYIIRNNDGIAHSTENTLLIKDKKIEISFTEIINLKENHCLFIELF